jgi:hypothetical protein
MSAATRTGSPATRFTGKRPPSSCGWTFSMMVLPLRSGIAS